MVGEVCLRFVICFAARIYVQTLVLMLLYNYNNCVKKITKLIDNTFDTYFGNNSIQCGFAQAFQSGDEDKIIDAIKESENANVDELLKEKASKKLS